MGAGTSWSGTLRAAALLSTLALAAVARAGTPASGQPVQHDQNGEARRLAKLSIREYETGEFAQALADAGEAYRLSGAPELLYNLGQCHRALEHWKQAEFSYRNYLHEKPDAPNRAQVLKLIAGMQAKQAASPASPGSPPPAAAPAPDAVVVVPVAPNPFAPAPAAAVAPVAETAEAAPPARSHALAWTLFAASAVAAGFAITGAVRVEQFQATASQVSTSSAATYQANLDTALGGLTNAQNWRTAAFTLGAIAVAAGVAGVFTW